MTLRSVAPLQRLLTAFCPKGKLDDRWEKEAYIICDKPSRDIPMYTVKKEFGKGKENTFHRILPFPLSSIPYINKEERMPRVPKRIKGTRENQSVEGIPE